MDPLVKTLARVRRRLIVQQWLRYAAVSLLYSVTLSCLWLILARLFPVLPEPLIVGACLIGLGWLVATYYGWTRRLSLIDAALAADARVGLKERFTSSLELAHAEGPMFDALHEDARAHLRSLDIPYAFPWVAPNAARWLWVPVLVFGIAYLTLPEFDLFGLQKRQVEAKMKAEKVQMAVERLQKEAEPLKEAAQEAEPGPVTEVMALIDRITDELERGVINEKQALAKLTDLRDALKERFDNLKESNPVPKLAVDSTQLGAAQDIAKDMEQGKFGEAAEKARELMEKMKEGGMSPKDLQNMAKDLEKLAQMLAKENPDLAKALAQAAESMKTGDMSKAKEGLAQAQASLEQMEASLKQLEALAKAGFCLQCCSASFLEGMCKGMGGVGPWKPGESDEFGNGMGGPGHGQGGGVGDLPDVDAAFDPSLLPGPMQQGKILMGVEQRVAPEGGAESTVNFIEGAFVQAQQETEQALEKEEIPRGSREFVRQYFGTLENEKK